MRNGYGAYIAIAGESVESLVKPELKAEFEATGRNEIFNVH